MPTFSIRALEPWRAIHPWLTDPTEEGGRAIPIENLIAANVGYEPGKPIEIELKYRVTDAAAGDRYLAAEEIAAQVLLSRDEVRAADVALSRDQMSESRGADAASATSDDSDAHGAEVKP